MTTTSVFLVTDTWGLANNKGAGRTSTYGLTKLAGLQEVTIIIMCVMSSTAINVSYSYNRMQAQPDNPVSENIYVVNRTCNLLYAETQRDEKGKSLDL